MACNHNCSNCTSKGSCEQKQYFDTIDSKIGKIIGVMSGKGGVGKSTLTTLLACKMKKLGYKVGILDADITGPSIAFSLGVKGRILGTKGRMFPLEDKNGIKVMSVNLLMEDETQPVVWRGPILGGAVKQFYSETVWGELDYLFVDMPPGTSDIQLTVLNNIPLDGVIIVSTPQDLVSMIVSKCVNLVHKVNVKILGIIENMAYVTCPDCGKEIEIYGKSKLEDIASNYDLTSLARMGIDSKLANLIDNGEVYEYNTSKLDKTIDIIKDL